MTSSNKPPSDSGDWKEYRRLVITELTSLKDRNERISERLARIEMSLAELKPRIGIWSAIATGMGAVGGMATATILNLLKK